MNIGIISCGIGTFPCIAFMQHASAHIATRKQTFSSSRFQGQFWMINRNTNISFPEMPFKVSFANCRPFPLRYHRAEPVSIAQLQWNSIRGLDPLGTLSQWRHHFSILWHFYQGTASLISVTELLQWSKFTRNFTKIQVFRKISFTNSFLIAQSFWNYAQSTAVMLPCSVHNFKMSWQLQLVFWRRDVSRDLV